MPVNYDPNHEHSPLQYELNLLSFQKLPFFLPIFSVPELSEYLSFAIPFTFQSSLCSGDGVQFMDAREFRFLG